MGKKKILRPLLIGVILCLSGLVRAQPPRGPFVVSPQVLPDKRVTFSYLAPTAKDVKLAGSQFGAINVPMTKDSTGIWRVTVGPVRPDVYPYSFTVDGVAVRDPANEDFFPNERFKAPEPKSTRNCDAPFVFHVSAVFSFYRCIQTEAC